MKLDHPVYFLTWTTYGSWMPGDGRGWVSQERGFDSTMLWEGNESHRAPATKQLKHPSVKLNQTQRSIVEQTIHDVCTHRDWHLHAVNCRTNHVHLVVLAIDHTPERAMNSFKSWCSRRLNETFDNPPEKWWTRHGSTRYLNDERTVQAAVKYVLEGQ